MSTWMRVASLLRQGHDVRVVDAISGQDLTRVVLTQIIVEDAKAPDSTFPIEILRQMVVSLWPGNSGKYKTLPASLR